MHFEKVSIEQWNKDCHTLEEKQWKLSQMTKCWDSIILPKQGSRHSMGMDFFAPYDIEIPPHCNVTIPTGIRWVVSEIEMSVGLLIVPRSGLGFKHGIRLANTVGIIDSDYQFAHNEGHIMIKFYNPSSEIIEIEQGNGFAQGIVVPYFICDGAASDKDRVGGFGSTTK